MAKESVQKVLQTKLAISEHSFRTNQPPKLSIYEAMKSIHATFEGPTTRRAVVGEKIVECRGYKEKEDVLGVYLVGYIPNDEVGIVPHTSEDLELFPPPENADFLDGEMMALISERPI
ncbi:hypothetical protein K7H91_21160 [Martelella mediterranea]|uniref:hypothetical protein n=1 Tax=Martelella mediterranea TaxID=293089 RepID=UPI001E34A914|nr:hypothetical protein [Martelella mediterranea]MCD1636274.1 hypothetical protein [Martelella mediterranea]